ncbi:hypothetical protein G9A89_012141 [Geosiphon pyriformis]|nr:hypothetical protein G9A89_012141 [Geosiphon pyriformis]
MSKKKAPKGVFHGPANGFFLQKKKVVLENIKHLGNEKNISLNKSEFGDNVFSGVNSLFGDKKGANITGINVGSLLNSAVNTFKTKHVNTGAVFGSSLSSSNFDIDDNEKVFLSFYLSISLNKKWVDPKIVKTQVEKIATCNVQDINVSAKQKDVVCWYKDMSNLILIITKTKLKGKVCLWIAGKFEDICVFTFGLNSEYLDASIVVVIDSSLAKHVYKVSEVPG